MKKILLFTFFVILFCNCQKSITSLPKTTDASDFILTVKANLQKTNNATQFSSLDFNSFKRVKLVDGNYIVKLNIYSNKNSKKYLFIKTDSKGTIQDFKNIEFKNNNNSLNNTFSYSNSSLSIHDVDGNQVDNAIIKNGFIRNNKLSRQQTQEDFEEDSDYGTLPEIILIADHYSNTTTYFFDLSYLFSFDNYYTYIPIERNIDYFPSDNTIRESAIDEELIKVDKPEPSEQREKIDLAKKFECFNSVPSTGAKYYAQLNVDIPVNGKPNMSVDPTLSPGHVFITMTKENGSVAASETFGFYPQSGLDAFISNKGVSSEMLNDGPLNKEHEYNASIFMEVTANQFLAMQVAAQINSTNQYELRGYNCASYALAVFNTARPVNDWIKSNSLYNFWTGTLSDSPQGVYLFLQDLQKNYNYNGYIESGVVKHAKTSTNCK
ncbi:MAG: hypothetical protein J0I41_07540 [Filimonas sp.]|nr:hypothetical protein [Filimonas sp.]